MRTVEHRVQAGLKRHLKRLRTTRARRERRWIDRLAPVLRRWDASGQLIAERLALGGSVTARDITVDASTHRCEVELIFNFGGTTSIQRSFAFQFHPGDPAEAFCLH